MKTAWLLLLLLGVGALGGCAVNPATGKSDFVMMSEQQELGMGARYNQEILKQFPRYNDEKLQAYVQRVGERVARSSHRSNLQYHFTVIDSPDINAFALPGGYIYIHRRLTSRAPSRALHPPFCRRPTAFSAPRCRRPMWRARVFAVDCATDWTVACC